MNAARWIALACFLVFVAYVVWDWRRADDEPFFEAWAYGPVTAGPFDWELDELDAGMRSTLVEIRELRECA